MTIGYNDLVNTLVLALQFALADTHTATVAVVRAVNEKTIDCQPVITRVVDGESVELPVFVEVPPIFLQGGGSYTAHPIAVGDYCLLIFAERCFDRWYAGQDMLPPLEIRMHDYSDGFALVGINPLSTAITIPSVIQQTGDTNQDGDYTHQGDRTQTGNYNLTGDFTHEGAQTHTGDTAQTGNHTASGLVKAGGLESTAGLSVSSGVTIGGAAGWSGTFATGDGRTVTVNDGFITDVS
jgi:hypothetical protein